MDLRELKVFLHLPNFQFHMNQEKQSQLQTSETYRKKDLSKAISIELTTNYTYTPKKELESASDASKYLEIFSNQKKKTVSWKTWRCHGLFDSYNNGDDNIKDNDNIKNGYTN